MTQNEQPAQHNPETRHPQSSLRGQQPRPGTGLTRLAHDVSFTPQEPGYITIEVLGVNRSNR